MYMLSLTNFDYFFVLLFFAITFIVVYHFRHRNQSAIGFVSNTSKVSSKLFSKTISFGILEFVILGVFGAKAGVMALIYLLGLFILFAVFDPLIERAYARHNTSGFIELVGVRFSRSTQTLVGIISLVGLIFIIDIFFLLSFQLFENTFGLNFAKSVINLTGFSLICLLVGGISAYTTNKLIQSIFVSVVLVAVIIIGVHQIGGIHQLTQNLQIYAKGLGQDPSYYTQIKFSYHTLTNILLLLVGVIGYALVSGGDLLVATKTKCRHSILTNLLIVLLLTIPGIIAISSSNTSKLIDGNQIVTKEAQLSNGQMGYIVKTIASGDKSYSSNIGIVPSKIDAQTGLELSNQYDYSLASLATFKHYVSNNFVSVIMIFLIALFVLGISQYLFYGATTIDKTIIRPYKLLEQYGEEGQLWSLRMSIIFLSGISLVSTHFLLPYFDLLHLLEIAMVSFFAPLTGLFLISIFSQIKGSQIFSILVSSFIGITTLWCYPLMDKYGFGIAVLETILGIIILSTVISWISFYAQKK